MEVTENDKKKYYYNKYIKYKQKYLDCMKLLKNNKGGDSDRVISIILNQDKESLERRKKISEEYKHNDPFFKNIIDIDKELRKRKEKYKEWELEFIKIKDGLDYILENNYLLKIKGGIHLAMDYNEIIQIIRNKLLNFRKNKLLITEEEFKKIDETKWYERGNNLTRVWGAEYLKYMFIKDSISDFSVPEYMIVVNNLDDIRIQITTPLNDLPCICKILTGSIYGTNIIDGIRSGDDPYVKGTLKHKYNFNDFAPSNVLSKNGILYVVDTEMKSFNIELPELLIANRDVLGYLHKRFMVINRQNFLEYDNDAFTIRITIDK